MDRERKEEEERKKLGIEKEEEPEEEDDFVGGPWKRLDAEEIKKKVFFFHSVYRIYPKTLDRCLGKQSRSRSDTTECGV